MAVEIEAPGQLQEFLEILRKRKWQVAIPAALILTLGCAFAVLVPKKYIVETQVELRATVVEDLDGAASALSIQAREARNAALHIQAPNRVRRVIEDRRWTEYLSLPPAEQAELVRTVVRNIDVTLPQTRTEGASTFVTIKYRDVDPERAVDFLEHLREDWTTNEVERGRRAIEAQRRALQNLGAELEGRMRMKQAELSELQSAYALSPTQPVPGRDATRGEDPVYTAYQKKLDTREDVRKELAEIEAKLEASRRQIAQVDPRILKQVLVGGVDHAQKLSEIELQIANLERRRSAYFQGTKRQILTQQIDQAQEQLQLLRDQERRAEAREEWIDNPAYQNLQERIAEMQLERARSTALLQKLEDDLALRQDELRERNEIYALVGRIHDELSFLRTSQADLAIEQARNHRLVELLSGPAGNPFQVISPVTVPSSPSEPSPWLIIVFSLVAGIGVGLGIAVLTEYSKSCFRSPADINRVMVVPVLGVVNTIRTRADTRHQRLRRLTVGLATGLLIGTVTFVTWAWAANPDLLSPRLREQIEEFRRLFV